MFENTHNRDAILMAWREKQAQLKTLSAEEKLLREEAIAASFAAPEIGTNTLELGNGYKLKATLKQNVTVQKNENGDYSHIPQVCQLIGESGNYLFKWKPELDRKVYDSLTHEEQLIVNRFITFTDGTPALEIIEPPKGA